MFSMDPPTEAEVGITEFASAVPGFTGILKQRQECALLVCADVFAVLQGYDKY